MCVTFLGMTITVHSGILQAVSAFTFEYAYKYLETLNSLKKILVKVFHWLKYW